jgi:hypothetical protein
VTPRRPAIALVGLLATSLAACAARDEPGAPVAPTKAQYVERVDRICARFDAQSKPAEAELRSASQGYSAADVVLGQLAAPLARLTTLVEEAHREMRAVPVPTGDAGRQARDWVAVVGDNVRGYRRLQGIVRERDQAGFQRFVQEDAPAIDTRVDARARALGLRVCDGDDGPRQGGGTPAPAPGPSPGSEGPTFQRAALGQPLRVRSEEGDVVLRVTRVRPRLRESRYSRLPRGQRLVGVDLEVRNLGSRVFDPPLTAISRVVDTRGGQGRYATLIDGPCGTGFALNLTLTPGTAEEGCVPFTIDEDAAAARLQVRLGYGDDQVVAEFDLRGGAGGPQPPPEPEPQPEPVPPGGGAPA